MVLTYLLYVCTLNLNSALLCLSAVLPVFDQRCICMGGWGGGGLNTEKK